MKPTLVLIALVSLTMACGNKEKKNEDTAQNLEGRYTVNALEGTVLEEAVEIWLSFDPAESRVNGKAACNTFFGSYTQEGESIQLGQMGSTMMACPDPLMQYERQFLDLLSSATTVAMKGENLILKNEDDSVIITARKSEETE